VIDKMLKRPEILAPSGNMSSLKAAIAAGADACYLAGNSFGARAYADNFTDEELIEAIDLAHLYGVKIYLTCNTLIKNSEMKYVKQMLEPLYRAGLDAVLVQDFGVLRMIRENFPDLPIHTSTQMNILTKEGVLLAKEMGASRVVAAREMTLKELADIRRDTGVEIEAFVHGAMCL
jgi:putative protease